MVHDRIAALRERISRREQRIRADRQASSRREQMQAREQEADDRARARRIERGEPEGTREEVAASAAEARELASDAKTLISTELGISRDDAEGVIEEGAGLISDLGDRVDQLDLDDDGDTDLLEAFDPDEVRGGAIEAVGGGDVEAVDADGGGADPIFDPFEDGPQ